MIEWPAASYQLVWLRAVGRTHALLAGSPALDTGDTTLTTDQRGVPRPLGVADDIGAFELGNPIKVSALLTVTTSGQRTDTTPVLQEGPAGVFSFTARYCNKSTSTTLTSLFTRTRELTNGNSLVNRDRDGTGTPPGGVGSELDFPLTPPTTTANWPRQSAWRCPTRSA